MTSTQVYISYWMQSAIAIIGFLLLQLYDSWIKGVGTLLLLMPYGYHEAKTKVEGFQRQCRKRLDTLIDAFGEFHKAQCFFIMAIEIAAQIVTRKGSTEEPNLESIYLNYDLLRIIGMSGLLPTTLTLFYLHSAGRKSWYLFILTLVSVVLALALYMSQFSPTPKISNI